MTPKAKATASPQDVEMKETYSNDNESAPWLLLQWQKAYQSIPKIYIPFTNIDISFCLICSIYFPTVRYLGYRYLISIGWPEGTVVTKEASGSMAAISHSVLLVPPLVVSLVRLAYKPARRMDTYPPYYQDAIAAILQFCTAYMVYDSLFSFILLRWEPGVGLALSSADYMFLGHHFATSFYMTSTRVVGAGHVSAMICMAIGEATNPFHNGFLISEQAVKLDCCNGPMAQAFHSWIEFLFASSYCLCRIIIGPLLFVHITYHLVAGSERKNVPIWLRVVWLLMIWGVEFGSIPWIQECWDMFMKHVGTGGEAQEL